MRDLREDVALLKKAFLDCRDPPVELPADSVIENVVTQIRETAYETGRESGYEEGYNTCLDLSVED